MKTKKGIYKYKKGFYTKSNRPERDTIINSEDIQNLHIELNRNQSLESFLKRV